MLIFINRVHTNSLQKLQLVENFYFCLTLYVAERWRRPTAKYSKVGEHLRHVIPGYMQCSMACGGRGCKYDNPSRWTEEEQAVKGLYSSW